MHPKPTLKTSLPVLICQLVRKGLGQFRVVEQKFHQFLDREGPALEAIQDGEKGRFPLHLCWTGFFVEAVEVLEETGVFRWVPVSFRVWVRCVVGTNSLYLKNAIAP